MKIFALRKFACPMGNEITPSYKKTSNVICNNKEDKSCFRSYSTAGQFMRENEYMRQKTYLE